MRSINVVGKLGVVHILRKHFLLEWKRGGHFFSEVSFLSLADHGGFGLLDPNDAFWGSKLGVPGHKDAASTPPCHPPEQTFELCSVRMCEAHPWEG